MMALLLALGFLMEQPRIEARLERAAAGHTPELERWLETPACRRGFAIKPGEYVLVRRNRLISSSPSKRPSIQDLFRRSICVASWEIQGHEFERSASTQVWRHGSKYWD